MNLIAGRAVVPELMQKPDDRASARRAKLCACCATAAARAEMKAGLAEVRESWPARSGATPRSGPRW